MSDYSDPGQIRADIERTRSALGSDVDALADKVTPSKIVDREKQKAKNALGSVKDRVFGVASDASDHASDALGTAGDALSSAPKRAVAKAEGAPIAVGLIAFGAGLLVSALLPASTKEKELAAGLKDAAQPLVDDVTDAAKEAAGHLKEPAADAFTAVKEQATDSAEQAKADATGAVDDVKNDANQAKHAVQQSNE
jgi:gas vesicle protein